MTFTHREDDQTLHLYAEPQVIDKATVQAELDEVDKLLASVDRDNFVSIMRRIGALDAGVDPKEIVPALQKQKASLEAQLALWDARTSQLTFTRVDLP